MNALTGNDRLKHLTGGISHTGLEINKEFFRPNEGDRKMTRFIISLIATIIIQILFYRFIGDVQASPPWVFRWAFKILLFICVCSAIRYLWTSIVGTQSYVENRAKTSEKMKLDQDIRQSILDRSRLAGRHLAEACEKLDSAGKKDLAEEVIKARGVLDGFAQSLSAKETGPGPVSAGADFADKTADRVIKHDKGILAIVEEIGDDAAELASTVGSEKTDAAGIVCQLSETARRLLEQINLRSEIIKGIK